MNATKKSLTTIGVAAALALGGIAVAQTATGSADGNTDMSSNATLMNNSGSSDLGSSTDASADTSTLGASSSTTMDSDTSLDNNSDDVLSPQVDRN